MTIKEVLDHQKLSRTNDQGFIHAAGRYQFIGNTLPGLVERSGLPLNTKFNEETQDLLAVQLIQDRGAEPWLADPRNRLQYDKEALAKIEKARQTPLGKPAPSSTPTPPPPAKPQPQTPKAGSIVDTGYKDYKGRPIKLEPAAAAAFKEMANSAMSSGLSKAEFEYGISSSYRDKGDNERVKGAEGSRHKVGLAIDINWNSKGGVWIRENAHKHGFHHLDYSPTSTHFDFTGTKTQQRPYSTTLASASTTKMNIDPNSLEGPEDAPLVVPMPINSIAKEPSGGGGGGATQRTPDIQPASSDLIALAYSLNQAFT